MKFIDKGDNRSKSSKFDEEYGSEVMEDENLYPEFIPTNFSWTTFQNQKHRAGMLEEIGKEEKSNSQDK